MSISAVEESPIAAAPSGAMSRLAAALRRGMRNVSVAAGFVLVLLVFLMAVLAPLLSPSSPHEVDRKRMNEPPRWVAGGGAKMAQARPDTLLGRDVRGRDVLSRVLYGARTSLMIGLAVVTIATVIGVALGCVAGYVGGVTDAVIMRLVDIMLAFPFLILALAVVSIFPSASLWHIAWVLGFTFWPSICRLTRGQVMQARDYEYVTAANALGAGHMAILLRHILPNCIAPVIIWFTMGIAGAIMGEASLSFLGLGDPDSLSWGTMIFMGLSRSNFPEEWWSALFPAAALAVTVLGFNLLGDGLQDLLNPKLKK